MNSFRSHSAAARLRQLSFPDAPRDDGLAALHARLADYDGYVAGYLSRLGSGEIRALPQNIDDKALGAELRAAARSNPSSEAARDLVKYFEAIEQALEELTPKAR